MMESGMRIRFLAAIIVAVVASLFCLPLTSWAEEANGSTANLVAASPDADGDGTSSLAVASANSLVPTACDNLTSALRPTTRLAPTSEGYVRVVNKNDKIYVENYDESFNLLNKKTLDMELPYWGGFFAGSDAYYIVEGQPNVDEVDSAEVIRVIKYSKSWERLGAARIASNSGLFGGEVGYPFHYGCVEMTELNGTLYIVTGHRGYVDPMYGQGHQGFLMLAVNEASMTGSIVSSNLWHSFAQYIQERNGQLYVLEQSEGSRCTTVTKFNPTTYAQEAWAPVLEYGGDRTSAWAIATYASVDDLAISSTHALGIGTSIDQSAYDEVTSDTAHNIYLTTTPLSNFTQEATTVKWLTNYNGGGKSFLGVKLTKINDNRFLVMWEESGTEQLGTADDTLCGSTLHCLFIDGQGNALGDEFTVAAPISDCHPVVRGSKVAWSASNGVMVNFYTIDAQTGAFDKKNYRVAGDSATWTLEGTTLTISGEGPMDIDLEAHYRYPVSSCSGGGSYSNLDNAWTSVRDSVETIVVGDGITAIPDSCFYGFDFVQEAIVSSSVSRIGDVAFAYCDKLHRVTLYPMSVEIGEDAFWTGSRWVGSETKVFRATLRCYKGSTVEQYAIDNNISYEYIREVSSGDMHRLYNPYSYEHFYTADADEFAGLVDLGWQDEGIGWTAPASGDPVYRLYNPNNGGDHHYTPSIEERNALIDAGWVDEEIGWFSDPNKTVPLYREYNPNELVRNHNYTADRDEHDGLVAIGWQDEDIAWYGA